MSSLIFLCGLFLTISQVLSVEIVITIPNGKVRGKDQVTSRNKTFYAFQEIPFAKPPVGKLRFKAPEPVDNWNGVLDATVSEKVCYQLSGFNNKQTEDCLYVNVYTPVVPGTSSLLPVMYYIYGGGFVAGGATFSSNGPHYFVEQDVVVVTVSYRVGPFGFLSTGDTVIPGNFGLKDQNLGLKWVKNNIKYFGGDPDKVTIFGLSAGGASVTYQMLSKQSEGLFRGAISESGSALCPWAYQRNYKEFAYKIGSLLDSSFGPNDSSEKLLELLQNSTPDKINSAAGRVTQDSVGHGQMEQGFWYTPVVEPEHETAFLTELMYEAIAKGSVNKVPLMMGLGSEEQLFKAANQMQFRSEVSQYDNNPVLLVNDNMHLKDRATQTLAGEAIHKIYTDGKFINDLAGAVKYFSDVAFSVPIIQNAKLQSQFSDVYLYQFSYHGGMGGNNVYIEGAGRVSHAEESNYLWVSNNQDNLETRNPDDVLTSRRYVKLFTDFAKTLNPTPEASTLLQNIEWPKVTPDEIQFLNIDKDLEIQTHPKEKAYDGWIDVYETYAIKPYDTF